ncbi:hypothetical protein J6590_023106 [Homalodisca vitripennis]|nr:hypothetical protein J6590_023106 [Homalodisca vitripennis]
MARLTPARHSSPGDKSQNRLTLLIDFVPYELNSSRGANLQWEGWRPICNDCSAVQERCAHLHCLIMTSFFSKADLLTSTRGGGGGGGVSEKDVEPGNLQPLQLW